MKPFSQLPEIVLHLPNTVACPHPRSLFSCNVKNFFMNRQLVKIVTFCLGRGAFV